MHLINSALINLISQWNSFTSSNEDEQGQTLVEYGLIIALISIAAIAIMATVGGNIVSVFTSVSGKLHS